MATDNFAATNNPLASPWEAVSGFGAFESSGGVAFVATHDVSSAMVYSTSSEQSSQATLAARAVGFGGPALLNPSNGNGYAVSPQSGGNLIIVKYDGGGFGDENSVAFATSVNDVIRLYINGSNQVVCSVNGTDRNTWSDTSHRTGLKPGLQGENEGDTYDDWTDGAAAGGGISIPVVQHFRQRVF